MVNVLMFPFAFAAFGIAGSLIGGNLFASEEFGSSVGFLVGFGLWLRLWVNLNDKKDR